MKNSLLILLIVFQITPTYSQKSRSVFVSPNSFVIMINIEEPKYTESKEGNFTIRDYYEFTDESRPNTFKLPEKYCLIAIPPNSHPLIQILNSKTESIEKIVPALNPTLSFVNDSLLVAKDNKDYSVIGRTNKGLLETIGYLNYRGIPCICLCINVATYEPTTMQISLLKEIEIKFTFDKAFEYKHNTSIISHNNSESELILNADLAGLFVLSEQNGKELHVNNDWIDYNSPYLKIGITEDGIFRITKNDFLNAGVDVNNINPKTFQLFESGNESPIYVYGELDNKFDDLDCIEFCATKNYSKISPRVINKDNEPYNEYMNRYTDTTLYFLTWGKQDGKRIPVDTFESTNVNDSLNYYDDLLHLELNPLDALFYTFDADISKTQLPYWDTGKSWYWSFLTGTASFKYNFEVNGLIDNKPANFYCKVVSRGSDVVKQAHLYNLKVNNITIDTWTADRFERTLLSGNLQSQNLKDGSNVIEIDSRNNNGGTVGQPLLDWFEVEYTKKIIAKNDSLYFEIRNPLAIKNRVIRISGIQSSLFSLYRIKPVTRKIESYKIEGNNLVFSDTSGEGYSWILAGENKIKKPSFIKNKTFVNLRNKTAQVDYLAVTYKDFINVVDNYLRYIQPSYNVKTELINVEDIFDEFGFGYPDPQAIKDFVKYRLDNSVKPLPSYLVLFGDANYDFKHYRFLQSGVKGGGNYVPSYGFPYSDSWFAIFDSLGVTLPQMAVGRIPINSIEEMQHYFQKVKNNFESQFDAWNKRFLFFSGGQNNNPSEISSFKAVHDEVIKEYIVPPPLSGVYTNFYKTENSDMGPYSADFIQHAIDQGGIMISYLGHSGTATWDNSISDVAQLENNVNKNPLISDFGCSTNKFAEPDIVCFGERFVLDPDGQAIGYLGNSSLGISASALNAPKIFFNNIIISPGSSIGELHLKTKFGIFSQLGNATVARVYNYCNVLLGDPVIQLKIPTKPNLHISNKDIIAPLELSDLRDSVKFKIAIENYGSQLEKKVKISIIHSYQNTILLNRILEIQMPGFTDTISVNLDTYRKPGIHKIKVILDYNNSIDEIYENDNQIDYEFNVVSNDVRDLLSSLIDNGSIDTLKILSPSIVPKNNSRLIFQIGNDQNLSSLPVQSIAIDSFYTRIALPRTVKGRTWFRYGLENSDTTWSQIKSYHNDVVAKFYLGDEVAFNDQNLKNLAFSNGKLTTTTDTVTISVISAGQFAGGNCLIMLNGQNLLSNTFFQGIGVGVFDSKTSLPDTLTWFNMFNNPVGVQSLTDFLNLIPIGKVIAMGVAWDAANNITAELKDLIKSLGSTKIDSLQFKGSWAFICTKGGNSSEIVEVVKGPYDGIVNASKHTFIQHNNGSFVTKILGPVQLWKTISLLKSDENSFDEVICTPIRITQNGNADTLKSFTLISGINDLSTLNKKDFSKAKFRFDLKNGQRIHAGIKSIAIDYLNVPELGTNYQVVSLSSDTLMQGESENLSFYVYNVGESRADSFKVRVEVVKPDNSREKIFEQLVDSLGSERRKLFNVGYNTASITGSRSFLITIDPDNKITELYKDNNLYSIPFYVKANNAPASIKLTFDGTDILNGDYVSSNPEIKVELNDLSLIPISDTSHVRLYLNNKRISLSNKEINYSFSSSNPKFILNYKPKLSDGIYSLKVVGTNATGQVIDSSGVVRQFLVSTQAQILYVYNYPNPFSSETYFTFKLTQIPDELRIKIFTISGRMIKELVIPSSNLNYDFNRIEWDGRDADGDLAANGVYLYKIIMKKGGETIQSTQKLAIVR